MSFPVIVNEDIVLSVEEALSALSQAEKVMDYIVKTACYDPQIARMLAEQWFENNATVLEQGKKSTGAESSLRIVAQADSPRGKYSRRSHRELAKGRAPVEAAQGTSLRNTGAA